MADEGDEPRVICEFSDYDQLINGLRFRAAELNLSGAEADRLSGLPDRYAQKLLGPQQIRRLGACSLGPFFGALCVRGVLVEDRTALEKLRRQTTPRNNSYARGVARWVALSPKFMAEIGRKGAQARIDNSTEAQRRAWARAAVKIRFENSTVRQRREWARKAANARWRKGAR